MRGLCANAAEGYRAFSTPWGAPTLAEAAGAEDFPLEAKYLLMAWALALYALHFLRKVKIISRLHLSALWAGFVCQLQTSPREFYSYISRPINKKQTRGFEVKIMVKIRCQTVPL